MVSFGNNNFMYAVHYTRYNYTWNTFNTLTHTAHTHTHTHMHACTHARTHARTHAHAHTHTYHKLPHLTWGNMHKVIAGFCDYYYVEVYRSIHIHHWNEDMVMALQGCRLVGWEEATAPVLLGASRTARGGEAGQRECEHVWPQHETAGVLTVWVMIEQQCSSIYNKCIYCGQHKKWPLLCLKCRLYIYIGNVQCFNPWM